jgi:hypothetical protein
METSGRMFRKTREDAVSLTRESCIALSAKITAKRKS